ncbi:MAG: hypothetical protein N2484_12680, partial [Clostridia bacterium]|nr:hypothetical protein [Clostridia bacterium]
MVTQSFMAEYLSKVQISANDIKKSETPKDTKSQLPFFKEVLNSTMEKPAAKQNYTRSETKKDIGREHEKFEDRKAQFKSYREAERSAEKDRPVKNDQDRSEEVSSVKSEKTDPKSKFKKAPVSEKEAVIENLAQVLGINQNDLMTLLGALNIKPEELMDP